MNFPNLFSPLTIGTCTLKNRVVSTGHHTYLADEAPSDDLIAYHEARAKGGAGLIICEIVAVHKSAGFSAALLNAESDDVIPAYAKLVRAIHGHGACMFAQLFHPGREILSSPTGMMPVAYAPSAVPNERFHIMPKPMSAVLIEEIIAGYGASAWRLAEAGFDGFEIVGNQGYLPAQFLNPRVNLRDDGYGGSLENRLRFVRECIATIRANASGKVVGLRISGDELGGNGLTQDEILEICEALSNDLDYLSVVAGSSASLGTSVHITPPMGIAHGYVAPYANAIKTVTGLPVIATGRINQPQIAEQIITDGAADLCGMTRALICDSHMPGKAQAGNLDDIRACIGCNQACIGRAHKGLGVSCIQHPESGRELAFATPPTISRKKKVLVAGGGPAGMKASAISAARGHEVVLYERDKQLGGQVKLAQQLPGREEFGGIITNLEREIELAGVHVNKGAPLTAAAVESETPDQIIIATGAKPFLPSLEGLDDAHAVNAWEVLEDKVNIGTNVVIADWRADWIGLGLAERLALAGSSVTLCTNAAMAGETLQMYTRNHYVGRLHKLGVTIKTHARLFGADEDSAYFQDTLTEEPIILENIDTVVLALGHRANTALEDKLHDLDIKITVIGDCVTPRSAEEAVYEGLQAGWTL
ncbi:MAG: FAD-dependent oxidoreductase [Hyphomicrobiales bacterium]